MTETKNSKMLDEGGKSVVALMAALMAAIFAFQLNASMLSPALTTMRVELNTTDAQIGLTQTVFFTSCAVFSLFLPRLGDLIGRKKVLLGILVLTALGCVVSLAAAFLAAYLAINEIQKLGSANWALVAVEIVIAAVLFVVFWNVEKRQKAPMVTTHYLKQRRTWGLLLTTLLTMTGVFAIMNGIVPALAQDTEVGAGMSASVVSFATLTPYALIGLAFGPVAGVLASKFGYRAVLRTGLIVSVVGVLFGIFVCNVPSIWALVVMSLALGVSYAGTANIMLNGLGIVLSPEDNPGYLPGLNSGAFNLGAGLSYAVLYAAQNAFTASGGATSGYIAAMVGGVILLGLAFCASLLIPKPGEQK